MQPIVLPVITVFAVEITEGPVYAFSAVPGGTPVLSSPGKPETDPEPAVGGKGAGGGEGGGGRAGGEGLDPGGVGLAPDDGGGAGVPAPGDGACAALPAFGEPVAPGM